MTVLWSLVVLLHSCVFVRAVTGVTCATVKIPTLKRAKTALVCHPDTSAQYPLHLLAHGDFGGGLALDSYKPLAKQIASYGFCVVAYASCAIDNFCDNGEASFVEAIKTIQYLEQNSTKVPAVNLTMPYSASGHSTGARVVLMLAAIVDNPQYLQSTKYASLLTPEVRRSVSKIKAVVADHADPMYDLKQDPDFGHFNITKMPVMIVTGTNDRIEPLLSGWKDFNLLVVVVFFLCQIEK